MQRRLTPLEHMIAETLQQFTPASQWDEIEEVIVEETNVFLKDDKKSWEVFFQGFFLIKNALLKGLSNTSKVIKEYLEENIFDRGNEVVKMQVFAAKAKQFWQHEDPGSLLEANEQKTLEDQKELSQKLSTSLIITKSAVPAKLPPKHPGAATANSVGQMSTSTVSLKTYRRSTKRSFIFTATLPGPVPRKSLTSEDCFKPIGSASVLK